MFANALLRRSVLTKPNASMQRLANFNQMNTMADMPMRSFAFRSAPALSDESDDLSVRERVKLDEFYADCPEVTMTDEEALKCMNFAADLAMVSFKDDKEKLDFKGAFVACLTFLNKLDEVDVKGVAALGSVLEFYGGNDTMVRTPEDFIREGDDQQKSLDFKMELNKLCEHMDDDGGDYVVVNKPKAFNPDSE